MIVVDTNVVSELMRPAPDATVGGVGSARDNSELYTTSVSMARIGYGIERLPDGARKALLPGSGGTPHACVSSQVVRRPGEWRVRALGERPTRSNATAHGFQAGRGGSLLGPKYLHIRGFAVRASHARKVRRFHADSGNGTQVREVDVEFEVGRVERRQSDASGRRGRPVPASVIRPVRAAERRVHSARRGIEATSFLRRAVEGSLINSSPARNALRQVDQPKGVARP
jgi:hypothetical protein